MYQQVPIINQSHSASLAACLEADAQAGKWSDDARIPDCVTSSQHAGSKPDDAMPSEPEAAQGNDAWDQHFARLERIRAGVEAISTERPSTAEHPRSGYRHARDRGVPRLNTSTMAGSGARSSAERARSSSHGSARKVPGNCRASGVGFGRKGSRTAVSQTVPPKNAWDACLDAIDHAQAPSPGCHASGHGAVPASTQPQQSTNSRPNASVVLTEPSTSVDNIQSCDVWQRSPSVSSTAGTRTNSARACGNSMSADPALVVCGTGQHTYRSETMFNDDSMLESSSSTARGNSGVSSSAGNARSFRPQSSQEPDVDLGSASMGRQDKSRASRPPRTPTTTTRPTSAMSQTSQRTPQRGHMQTAPDIGMVCVAGVGLSSSSAAVPTVVNMDNVERSAAAGGPPYSGRSEIKRRGSQIQQNSRSRPSSAHERTRTPSSSSMPGSYKRRGASPEPPVFLGAANASAGGLTVEGRGVTAVPVVRGTCQRSSTQVRERMEVGQLSQQQVACESPCTASNCSDGNAHPTIIRDMLSKISDLRAEAHNLPNSDIINGMGDLYAEAQDLPKSSASVFNLTAWKEPDAKISFSGQHAAEKCEEAETIKADMAPSQNALWAATPDLQSSTLPASASSTLCMQIPKEHQSQPESAQHKIEVSSLHNFLRRAGLDDLLVAIQAHLTDDLDVLLKIPDSQTRQLPIPRARFQRLKQALATERGCRNHCWGAEHQDVRNTRDVLIRASLVERSATKRKPNKVSSNDPKREVVSKRTGADADVASALVGKSHEVSSLTANQHNLVDAVAGIVQPQAYDEDGFYIAEFESKPVLEEAYVVKNNERVDEVAVDAATPEPYLLPTNRDFALTAQRAPTAWGVAGESGANREPNTAPLMSSFPSSGAHLSGTSSSSTPLISPEFGTSSVLGPAAITPCLSEDAGHSREMSYIPRRQNRIKELLKAMKLEACPFEAARVDARQQHARERHVRLRAGSPGNCANGQNLTASASSLRRSRSLMELISDISDPLTDIATRETGPVPAKALDAFVATLPMKPAVGSGGEPCTICFNLPEPGEMVRLSPMELLVECTKANIDVSN